MTPGSAPGPPCCVPPPCTPTQLSSHWCFPLPGPSQTSPPSSAHLPCPLPSPGRHSSPRWAGPMQLPTQRGLQSSGHSPHGRRPSQGHRRCWWAERGLILPVSPRAGASHGMRTQRPVSPSVCCSSLTGTLIAHSRQPLRASPCPQHQAAGLGAPQAPPAAPGTQQPAPAGAYTETPALAQGGGLRHGPEQAVLLCRAAVPESPGRWSQAHPSWSPTIPMGTGHTHAKAQHRPMP